MIGAFGFGQHTGVRYVQVQFPVAVDVHEADPGLPGTGPAGSTRLLGYVFKFQTTLVQIEAVGRHIGGKIQIDQPVAIQVARRYAPTVVKIFIDQNIGIRAFGEGILKVYAGFGGRKQGEQSVSRG